MTNLAPEPYRHWRTAVFAIVVVVAPLVFGGLLVAAALTIPALDSATLFSSAAGGTSIGRSTTSTSGQSSGESARSTTTDTAIVGTPMDIARDSAASATSTAPDNVDGADVVTSYRPANMLDGNASTAWRTKGNGAGVRITIAFHGTARISGVGLVPGYAKTDPVTGVDRFRQEHRITAVNWHFNSGRTVRQAFADEPVNQRIAVDTVASSVTIEILGVRPATHGYDYTPISDVTVLGVYR